jgi:hypothetical protein
MGDAIVSLLRSRVLWEPLEALAMAVPQESRTWSFGAAAAAF